MIASISTPRVFRELAAALLLIATVGCGSSASQTRYLHPNADLGAIRKVAVLPFDTVSSERGAAEKVQKIFYLELLALEAFEVAEPGEVAKVARNAQVDTLGAADYQRIGKELGVDGFFTGTVVDFEESQASGASSPDVTIQLRLIETQTGTTIWSAGQSRSGVSVSTRLFGVGGESLTDAARRLIREELSTLLK